LTRIVISQLTLPTILFSKYLGIENPGTVGPGRLSFGSRLLTTLCFCNQTMLALLRVQNIEIGIISALLLNILLWPYHAKVQLTVTCSKATDRLIKLYLSMSKYAIPFCASLIFQLKLLPSGRQVLRKDHKLNDETRKRYEKLENATRVSCRIPICAKELRLIRDGVALAISSICAKSSRPPRSFSSAETNHRVSTIDQIAR
jgi:hypothetical protein